MNELTGIFQTSPFLNGFWIFVGVVSKALIQYFLASLTMRRQADTALKVMQIEIAYNRSEVENFRSKINWLKQRISSGQITEDDLFLPMQKFDYSSIGPLTSSGYFHVLLGPELVRSYLEFYHFFRSENGEQLTTMLRTEHSEGTSMALLEWVEREADNRLEALRPIETSRLRLFGRGIKQS